MKTIMKRFKAVWFVVLAFFVLVPGGRVLADIPDGYYDSVTGLTGEQLKAGLHNIIKGHKEFSYRQMWNILAYTDADPGNPNKVILLYTGWSYSSSNHGGGPSQWNREHTWAKSHGEFGTKKGAGTDAHHLRPTDVTVNAARGNLDFDNGGTVYNDPDGPTKNKRKNGVSWEPWDKVKGDVARMLFYMAVRYEGGGGEPDLELNDKVKNGKQSFHGKLSVLLAWHRQDPVDDWERRRNDRIYEKQENRNPFIDHPGYAGKIWDDSPPPGGWQNVTKTIETPHKYPVKMFRTWTINQPGAAKIKLFFHKMDIEKGYDFVVISDGNHQIVQVLAGSQTEFESMEVPGDTVHIGFFSDDSVTGYGFKITRYAYKQ